MKPAALALAIGLAGCAAAADEAPAPTITYYLLSEDQVRQIDATLAAQRRFIQIQAEELQSLRASCGAGGRGT